MHMIRLARGWPSEIAGVWRMLWCTDPLSLRADAAASKYSHVVQQRSKCSRVACTTALWTLVCNGCMYSEELRLGRGHNQPLTLINKTDWQIHLMPQSSDRFILNYTSQKLLHMMSIVLLHPLSLIFHCRFQQHNLFNDKTPSSVSQNNVEFIKQGHQGPIGGSKWMVRRYSRWGVF